VDSHDLLSHGFWILEVVVLDDGYIAYNIEGTVDFA
jgi:hypothetical protein